MTPSTPYRIETERLVLRCWQPEDAAHLKEAVEKEKLTKRGAKELWREIELMEARVKLEQAVDAGKISEDQAHKKLEALEKEPIR